MEGVRKTTKDTSRRSEEQGRGMNHGRPEYKAGISAVRFLNWHPFL